MPLAAFVGLAAGRLSGGRLGRAGRVRLRATPVLAVALLVQVSLGALPAATRLPLVLASSAVAVAWAATNARRIPPMGLGLTLVAAGILLNLAVIVVNQGMPVSADAMRVAGIADVGDVRVGRLYKHVPLEGSDLRLLGDVIPVRPFRTVVSVGDVVMLCGTVLAVAGATRTHRCEPAAS